MARLSQWRAGFVDAILVPAIVSGARNPSCLTVTKGVAPTPSCGRRAVDERFSRRVLIALVVILGLWVARDYVQLLLLSETDPRGITPRGDLAEVERTAIDVFDEVAPSVVSVTTFERSPRLLGHETSGTRGQLGLGSGFVWDAAGHIVTNDHVVRDAEYIAVRFGSEQWTAAVVGRAPEYEIAVLRLIGGPRPFRPLRLGTSADLRVGQTVFAIGNPFGLSHTLTQGLVSALERHLPTATGRELRGVIQTDAAINPGNSGGPLLDSAGRLIGMNTAILSPTGAFSGVGFAIPIDMVNRVVSTLIRDGRLPRAGIGVVTLRQELTERLGVKGVSVVGVLPGSPAVAAGLKCMAPEGDFGDVIIAVNGSPVQSSGELAERFEEIGIGNRALLQVERNGKPLQVLVTIADLSHGS